MLTHSMLGQGAEESSALLMSLEEKIKNKIKAIQAVLTSDHTGFPAKFHTYF